MKAQSQGPAYEAAEWLAILSDPKCTDGERRAFARWLTRSNVNVEEFLTLSTLARRLETRTRWPEIDVAALIAEARASADRIVPLPAQASRPSSRGRFGFLRWSLAAMVLAGVLIATLMFGQRSYSTGYGELRSITLRDGSIVQLDARTVLRERFSEQERWVELESGAAIFTVAKDAERPFRVTAGVADIVAVGTAFNVAARRERTVVTVLEGRVRVDKKIAASGEAAGSGVELTPGQQAVVEADKPIAPAVQVDPVKVTAWTARRLYFEDVPLGEAASEFSRYSARTIRFEDPTLEARQITGTFDAADPEALVAFLRRYSDAHIETVDNGWVVRRK